VELSLIVALMAPLLAVSIVLNFVQWTITRRGKNESALKLNEARARCVEIEKAFQDAERGRQTDRIRLENEQHELLKSEKAKAYEEGRGLGKVEQRKDHIEELTQLQKQFSANVLEEVEKATADARGKVRAEYELQSKMFSVQISPYVQITEDKGLISSSYISDVGYQYQLLVNGIPVFQPHVITERSEVRKEINPESVKELASFAAELAGKAIETYLSGGGRAFAKLAPAIVKRLARR
jgi:hypothetical protein